jgi:SAM-dependent methyltransferase
VLSHLLNRPQAYRLWQAPFAERKLAPVLAGNDISRVHRVLDVGCGPGTNTRHFRQVDYYLGIDVNPRYVEYARERYGRDFEVADVTTYQVAPSERFDFILINSLLHHLDTPAVRRLLSQLARLLTEDGHVHILDLVLPPRRGVARLLATLDRGDHPRPLSDWEALFRGSFQPVAVEPYQLQAFGVVLWNMVYLKGHMRRP